MKTSTMWSANQSSNQEDDGLEPIVGSMGVRPSTPPAMLARPTLRGAVPTLAPPSGVRRSSHEPTLILRERQLDSVRAEVMRHRRTARFKRQMGTAGWVAAGGLAVLIGAFLARGARSLLESNPAAPADTATVVHVEPASSTQSRSAAPPAQPERNRARPATPRRSAIRLEEVPTE